MKPLLIAHRGDTVHFSENTIAAFQSAFDLGADGVELDVHLSDKGDLLVVHNFLYDRAKVYPTLPEVLQKFAQKGRLEIEIKSFDPLIVEKIAHLIAEYNPVDVELTSSILPMLPIIKTHMPNIQTGMIFQKKLLEDWMTPEVIYMFVDGYMQLTKANVLHLDFDYYTPELVTKLHAKKYLLHTHIPIASKEMFKKIKTLDLDQCTFDDMNLLKETKSL